LGDVNQLATSTNNSITFGAGSEIVKGVYGISKNMAAGDLIINGIQVGATQSSSDLVSVNDKASSAIAKVAAINAVSAQTGVTATVGNTQAAGSAMTVASGSGVLTINGVSTSTIATVGDAGLDRAAVVTAINNISQQTGVRAVDTGDINKGVVMIADDGRNISLTYGSGLSAQTTGLGGITSYKPVAPTSLASISVSSGNTGASDTITINNVATAALGAGASLSTIANKINAITSQTGVTAALKQNGSNWGIELSSTSNQLNVSGTLTGITLATIGIAANNVAYTQTFTGSYQLGSSNGSPIVVGSTSNGDLRTAGLTAGTYTANTSVATTTDRAVATAAASTTTTGLLQAGTLRINGTSIVAASTADDTSSAAYVAGTTNAITSSAKGASAIAIAAAINKSSATTGVTATAAANVVSGTSFDNTQTLTNKNLYINGVTVALGTLTAGSYTRGDVATLINAQQGQTGVVATDNGRGLTLTAADGRNISLGLDDLISATTVGITGASIGAQADTTGNTGLTRGAVGVSAATSATTYARVTLSSDKSFTVEGGSDGNANFALLGFKTGTFGGVDNGVKVSKIDITTQANAQVAITALDAALKSVSLNQARLGAFQNRLDQVVSNLTTMNQNMSASRSRVQDADYATETTNLAKSQIISQAATAMLAQANQSSQSVLALLK
jgi:flagellin